MIRRSAFCSARNFIGACTLEFAVRILWLLTRHSIERQGNTFNARTVVFVGTQHLGDVLLTTPAIDYLKKHRPEAIVISVVSRGAKDALKSNTQVAEVVVFELPWFNGEHGFMQNLLGFRRFVQVLRDLQPGVVVNYNSTRYYHEHIAAFLSGAPVRIGFGHKGLGFLLTVSSDCDEQQTFSERAVTLIQKSLGHPVTPYLTRPLFKVSNSDVIAARSLLHSLEVAQGLQVVAINPWARHPFLWPTAAFVQLCKNLNDKIGLAFLFVGSQDASEIVNEIRFQLPFKSYSVVGRTSLGELGALLSRVNGLVTVDTGTRHLANAVGCPTIVLRHSADTRSGFHGYTDTEKVIEHKVDCSPCGRSDCPLGTYECVTHIPVNTVVQAVLQGLRC